MESFRSMRVSKFIYYLLRASFRYLFVNIPYIFLSTIPSYAFSHFTTGYCDLPCDSFYEFIRRFNGHIICQPYTKYMLYNIVSNIFEKLLPFYYCSMRPYNTLKFFSFLHVLQVQVNNQKRVFVSYKLSKILSPTLVLVFY